MSIAKAFEAEICCSVIRVELLSAQLYTVSCVLQHTGKEAAPRSLSQEVEGSQTIGSFANNCVQELGRAYIWKVVVFLNQTLDMFWSIRSCGIVATAILNIALSHDSLTRCGQQILGLDIPTHTEATPTTLVLSGS